MCLLALGDGRLLYTRPVRNIVNILGAAEEGARWLLLRLRARSQWAALSLALAGRHAALARQTDAGGEQAAALAEYRAALALLGMAVSGDGHYFRAPMPICLRPARGGLDRYGRVLELSGERCMLLEISYARGTVSALDICRDTQAGRCPLWPGWAAWSGTRRDWWVAPVFGSRIAG